MCHEEPTAESFVGVVLVALTGWLILDPLIALLVAANIVWAANGVLDRALPAADQACIASILAPYAANKAELRRD